LNDLLVNAMKNSGLSRAAKIKRDSCGIDDDLTLLVADL
jgi:hypothetical protein